MVVQLMCLMRVRAKINNSIRKKWSNKYYEK